MTGLGDSFDDGQSCPGCGCDMEVIGPPGPRHASGCSQAERVEHPDCEFEVLDFVDGDFSRPIVTRRPGIRPGSCCPKERACDPKRGALPRDARDKEIAKLKKTIDELRAKLRVAAMDIDALNRTAIESQDLERRTFAALERLRAKLRSKP